MAAEAASDCTVPARAAWLRVVLLERERIANHLGDLGALGNDAGLALGLAQFARLKEVWVRLNAQLFGHRFMMDCVIPGGVRADLSAASVQAMLTQCDQIETEVRALRAIYEEHSGLQDRFIGAGRVAPKLAAELGLCGLAGRASAQAWDARTDQAMDAYASLNVRMATQRNGDVAARVAVRFDEIFESMRLLREVARRMPSGPIAAPFAPAPVPRWRPWAPDGSKAGAARSSWDWKWTRKASSCAAIATIPHGRTGRSCSTRSWAISCRTSR
jgi:Ni,Fe-hydrogenase III large subunit